MKKIYIILCLIFACSSIWAGTPTMDGTFDGVGVWGNPQSTADLQPGWNDANAKKLYVTYDANYLYIGAEVVTKSWQQFVFLINTKAGGGSTDSWGRKIAYNHSNLPDYIYRGNFGRDNAIVGSDFGNYAEFHTWDGTQWTGVGTQVANTGTTYSVADNIANDFNMATGFIEVRIALGSVNLLGSIGSPTARQLLSSVNVQFLIVGDGNNHGSFDAVPDDNNAADWDLATPVTVSNFTAAIALPVELTTFNAKAQGSSINLDWATASEKQSSHFDIERSADAQNWATIGSVKGAGTSVRAHSYVYTDNAPLSNVNYYRLKQVDLDGKFEYSPVATAAVGKGKLKGIFPNPVKDKLNVIAGELSENATATIFDLSGKAVQTTRLNGAQIDVSNLNQGMYLLRVSDDSGQTSGHIRFVKN